MKHTKRHKSEAGLALRSRNGGAGFTLLEVLVAMTILAILGAALCTMFTQASGTWQMADARTQQFAAAREALGLISMELRQAVAPPSAAIGGFWGSDVKRNGKDINEVYFVAPTETRSPEAGQDVCVIGYWVNDDGDLMRYCLSDDAGVDNWKDLSPKSNIRDKSERIGVSVRSLTFEYWGPTDTKWQGRKTWQSPDEGDTLPQAVRITLVIQDPNDPTDEDKDKTFMTIVRLDAAKRTEE